jgi:hypothetical protein
MPFVKLQKNSAYFSRYQVKVRGTSEERQRKSLASTEEKLTFGWNGLSTTAQA